MGIKHLRRGYTSTPCLIDKLSSELGGAGDENSGMDLSSHGSEHPPSSSSFDGTAFWGTAPLQLLSDGSEMNMSKSGRGSEMSLSKSGRSSTGRRSSLNKAPEAPEAPASYGAWLAANPGRTRAERRLAMASYLTAPTAYTAVPAPPAPEESHDAPPSPPSPSYGKLLSGPARVSRKARQLAVSAYYGAHAGVPEIAPPAAATDASPPSPTRKRRAVSFGNAAADGALSFGAWYQEARARADDDSELVFDKEVRRRKIQAFLEGRA